MFISFPRYTSTQKEDDYSPFVVLSSGSPATLVSRDNTPASAAAEATIAQLTSPRTAAVPIVATAVCATVLIARIPAAFNQCNVSFFHSAYPPIFQ